jgi:hypothetical protein
MAPKRSTSRIDELSELLGPLAVGAELSTGRAGCGGMGGRKPCAGTTAVTLSTR